MVTCRFCLIAWCVGLTFVGLCYLWFPVGLCCVVCFAIVFVRSCYLVVAF